MTIKKTTSVVGSALVTLLALGGAQAQQGEAPNIVIVEIYGCTYNDGNDMSDLMAVTNRWNRWADEHNLTDYSANILTPHLYSPAFPYDVLWLGVYNNAQAMGSGEGVWLAEGGQLNAAFGEVVSCNVHAQYAGVAAHVPATEPNQSDNRVNLLAFQDCSLHTERTIPEAIDAHRQWGEFLAERGSDNFMGAIIPIAGEDPDADYDYKAVTGFDSAEAYGRFISTVVPGGLQRAGQLFGRVTECDTSRLYTSVPVRTSAQD
jgi:hypothetical protein